METIKWKSKGGRREREGVGEKETEKRNEREKEKGKKEREEKEENKQKKCLWEKEPKPLSRNICDSRNGSTV